jgi:hypothetical protein
MSSCPSSSRDAELFVGLSFDHRSRRSRDVRELLIRVSVASMSSVVVDFVTNEKAPRDDPCWRSSSSVTI